METFIMSIIIIVNFILQSTLFQHIAILGAVPNTALIIIVSIALIKGEKVGGIVGLIIGFIQDLFFSTTLGPHAFVYFFIGYYIGKAEKKVYKESIFIPIVLTAISTVAYYLLYYTIMYFLSQKVSFTFMFKNVGIKELVYNCILIIPIYKWFLKIFTVPSMKFRR